MGQEGTGVQCRILAEIRHGQGARRRLHLYRPDRAPVLHGQERVDAGAVRLDLRLSVHRLRHRPEWLEASKSCLDFMEKHCINREADGRMYFTVTGDGKPLRQRRYCFSEAFYAMANAEYYGVTGEKACLERARRAYDLYWDLNHGMADPTGLGPKTIPETRTGRASAFP